MTTDTRATTEAAAGESPFEHERVLITTGRRSGLTIAIAVHSTALGAALGGCRLWTYDHWGDALADALRLSQGMTWKNALAGLPAGGGKAVIHLPTGTALGVDRRRDVFLDLGDAIEVLGGSYLTAEDVGTQAKDMAVVAERTAYVRGLPAESGGLGDPGEYTARGVRSALRETLRRTTGSPDAAGRRVTIAGLGQVGSRLADRLSEEGAILTLSDVDAGRRAFAERLGAEWVDPLRAHAVPADIFVPAGVGGMLSEKVIDELAAKAVVGPANNQLAQPGGAARLAARGILYAPDYLVNAGGVIYLGADDMSVDERITRIDAIGATLAKVFDNAEESGITTLDAAHRLVQQRLRSSHLVS